jgi:hypothetical protein
MSIEQNIQTVKDFVGAMGRENVDRQTRARASETDVRPRP